MSSNNNLNDLFNNMNNINKNITKRISKNNSKSGSNNKIIIILIGILVLYLFYMIYRNIVKDVQSFTTIVPETRQGTDSKTPMNGSLFRTPNDGKYGTEFTYTTWLYINGTNFAENDGSCGSSKEGKKRCIFVKGSGDYLANGTDIKYPLLQAPGLWIYPNENKLEINMNTFASTAETCNIGNIPVGKWFHLVIMLIGNSMDIYINGQLKKRCKFVGVPKLNYGDLYLSNWGGFDGYVSKMKYYNRALQPYEIEQSFYEGPSKQMPSGNVSDTPPYLSDNYWMKTGFPNSTP
jgi:hypothetical protein